MVTPTALLGIQAEKDVERHIQRLGFRILDRNWRRPWGELDIVARKDNVIHFIEVKASAVRREGFAPTVRADWRKMAKVRRTARTWLAAQNLSPQTSWQMDVASVIMEGDRSEIELFQNI